MRDEKLEVRRPNRRRHLPIVAALLVLWVVTTVPSAAGDWLQWGGANRDFRVEGVALADSWGKNGPPTLWRRALGTGYSGIVVADGTLYTLTREEETEIVVALDAATGETRWEHRSPSRTYDQNVLQFGQGPNASPLIVGDLLVSVGYNGNLHALRRATGEPVWSHDLVEAFGAKIHSFGYAASPFVHDGAIVLAVGGDRGLMAFEPADGSVRWQTKPVDVSYSSPSVIDVDGQEQVILLTATEALAVEPEADGEVLWRIPFENGFENNSSDAIWDGETNRLWIATQADAGAKMLRLARDGDTTKVEELWSNPKVAMHFWPAVWEGERVYASIGSNGTILAAVDATTGKVAWRQRGFDRIKWLQVDGKLVMLDANGLLRLAEVGDKSLEILGEAKILEADAWTPPTLVGTTLYARDKKSIVAIDLGAVKADAASTTSP